MTAWSTREPHERKKEKTMSRTFRLLLQTYPSLRGRRSKGKGKGKGRETTREGGGRKGISFPFSLARPTRSREPKFPLPLLTPATQAKPARAPLQRGLFWTLNIRCSHMILSIDSFDRDTRKPCWRVLTNPGLSPTYFHLQPKIN